MKTLTKKFTLTLFIALAIFGKLTNFAQADGKATSLEGFKEIKVAPGVAEAAHLIDTVRPFLLNHPESLEGRSSVDMTVRKEGNGFVVNIIKSGYLDDSVQGEHFRGFVVRTSKGTWQLISMAVKYICYRKKSANGQCT